MGVRCERPQVSVWSSFLQWQPMGEFEEGYKNISEVKQVRSQEIAKLLTHDSESWPVEGPWVMWSALWKRLHRKLRGLGTGQ